MKYQYRCQKVSYTSETEAWEYVIHHRRLNRCWQSPYVCPDCGRYHLTSKWFSGNIPKWVEERSRLPAKEKYKEEVLSQKEMKEKLKLLKNKKAPLWLKIKNFITRQY